MGNYNLIAFTYILKLSAKKKSTHIKKPLNAFMLYMKEMRAKVVQEYTLKESAAINQILGKRVCSKYTQGIVNINYQNK